MSNTKKHDAVASEGARSADTADKSARATSLHIQSVHFAGS